METRLPDGDTLAQLNALGYGDSGSQTHERPLLICDVDEVILHLVDPFVEVLTERGYTLKSHSFQLTGNVFDAKTGREATQEEVWAGLTQLFEEQQKRQGLVDGAVDGLLQLSRDIDIVFLTNMPHEFGTIRKAHLAENGLNFPLITNTGSKVPAMTILGNHCQGSVGFIDDTPKNLEQSRKHLPYIHLFHFMANEDFRVLAGDIEGTHISTGDWQEVRRSIQSILLENISGT